MNEILGKLNEYLEAAERLVVEHAPGAAELVLMVVRMEAIYNLSVGIAVLGWTVWVGRKVKAAFADNFDKGMCFLIGTFLSAAVTCLFLLDFYNWLAAINPLAGLVYKLIN